MGETITADIDCPYCGETVPVKVKLENTVFKEYLEIEGYTWSSEPIPEIEVCISVDIKALAKDIDRLVEEEKERERIFKNPLDKSHGRY